MDRLTPREEIWIRAWCAVAGASDCKSKNTAASWADACVEMYEKRFPTSTNN